MKKLLLFFVFIGLVSCSSDDDSSTPDFNEHKRVKTVISLMNGSSHTYLYNGSGHIYEINFSGSESLSKIKYVYSGNNVVREEIHSIDNNATMTTNFTYDGDLIIKSETLNSYTEYFYNSSQQLITEFKTVPNSPQLDEEIHYTYYPNGSLKARTIVSYGTETYEYDNKINPYYNCFPSAFQKIQIVSENNTTKRGDLIFNYEYENDYPVRMTSQYQDDKLTYY